VVRRFSSGAVEVECPNKYLKESFPNGFAVWHFTKGNVKQELPSGVAVHFIESSQIIRTKLSEKESVYYFLRERQLQLHEERGQGVYKEIRNEDGVVQVIRENGVEETYYPGREVRVRQGDRLTGVGPDGALERVLE
jgi:hypothetical protein